MDNYYIKSKDSQNVCILAFATMATLISAFLHGASALDLGIGSEEDAGYLQCPDPGPPSTPGGTVLFNLKWVATK